MRYIIPVLLALFVLLMALAGSNIKRAEAEAKANGAIIRLAAAQDSATYWQGRSQQLEAELVEMIHTIGVGGISRPLLHGCIIIAALSN